MSLRPFFFQYTTHPHMLTFALLPLSLLRRAQWILDEVYLRRQHGFSDRDIAAFSLGGEDTPLDSLAEDLYISQEMRDDVKKARAGDAA